MLSAHDAGTSALQAGAAPGARLLVVDDEPDIVELLSASLRFSGFQVTGVLDGREAITHAQRYRPDLVLLDVMMPGLDGFEVLRQLRAGGLSTPVLFLTARDATMDKVTALGLGGDDYVTKPFSLVEVVARIQAMLRRAGGTATIVAAPTRLSFADIELDEETYEVRKAGVPVPMSVTEFRLLRYFLSNVGRVLSKGQIRDHVWRSASGSASGLGSDSNVVESYVSYLRKKVDTGEPRLIHTLRGVGYVLRLPPS
jgi:two-component system OmpR family response regulator